MMDGKKKKKKRLGMNIQEGFLNYLCSVSQKRNNREKSKS